MGGHWLVTSTSGCLSRDSVNVKYFWLKKAGLAHAVSKKEVYHEQNTDRVVIILKKFLISWLDYLTAVAIVLTIY